MAKSREITGKQRDGLLRTLQARFEAQMHRHADLEWTAVQARVESNGAKLWSLNEMEQSGGEPDVVGVDRATGEHIFVDCSVQSPKGRRSVCYDREALEARKEHKPRSSAVDGASCFNASTWVSSSSIEGPTSPFPAALTTMPHESSRSSKVESIATLASSESACSSSRSTSAPTSVADAPLTVSVAASAAAQARRSVTIAQRLAWHLRNRLLF